MKKNGMMQMLVAGIIATMSMLGCTHEEKQPGEQDFIRIDGFDLVQPNGEKFFIKGTNLGHWLNPEGFMMLFEESASSYRHIDEALKEMVGEAVVDSFWRDFQRYYITREDIRYIRQTGLNTIRLPFHYRLINDEPFMGYASKQHGYEVLDSCIRWCREEGLYVVLDLHVAPGGQTGINIDDSYGYPWLLTTESHKQQLCDIWRELAEHYRDETAILGYDLLNEPVASSFFESDSTMLDRELELLLQRVVKAVREVDQNHIVMVSGTMWGQNYGIFHSWDYDSKLMFTCHRYHSATTPDGIQDFLDYRNKFQRPFYMGETGLEPDPWIADFLKMLEEQNIGWTLWPYKKMGRKVPVGTQPDNPWASYSRWSTTSMLNIPTPSAWERLVEYTAADRATYEQMRDSRPDQDTVRVALTEYIENLKFRNCEINRSYIEAMGMKP